MKAQDIILQLRDFLVRQTNLFTYELDIISLTRNPTTQEVTAITSSQHGLKVGDLITIVGVEVPFEIVTLTQANNIAAALTLNPHDLTKDFYRTVKIVGADQPEYNGIHNLLNVINNNTFEYTLTGLPVSPATGNIFLLADFLEGYNGLHVVKSVSVDGLEFTYDMPENFESPAQGDIKVRYKYRISGAATSERAYQSYTDDQAFNNLWAFVVLGDTFANKSRVTDTDAVSLVPRTASQKHFIIENFSIYIFNTIGKDVLSGRITRDLMEDIFKYLVKSVVGITFPGVFVNGEIEIDITKFVGHTIQLYNGSQYIHRFDFQQVKEILDPDIFPVDLTYPFRKILVDYLNITDNNLLLDDTILLRELE